MILNPARMASANGPIPAREVVIETMRESAERPISLIATFTATSFDLFHLGDSYRDSFEDSDVMRDTIGKLARDVRSEFVERGLFAGMRPVHDRVEFRSTPHGEQDRPESRRDRKCLQIFCGEVGMLLIVESEEPVEPLVGDAARLLGNQF